MKIPKTAHPTALEIGSPILLKLLIECINICPIINSANCPAKKPTIPPIKPTNAPVSIPLNIFDLSASMIPSLVAKKPPIKSPKIRPTTILNIKKDGK